MLCFIAFVPILPDRVVFASCMWVGLLTSGHNTGKMLGVNISSNTLCNCITRTHLDVSLLSYNLLHTLIL